MSRIFPGAGGIEKSCEPHWPLSIFTLWTLKRLFKAYHSYTNFHTNKTLTWKEFKWDASAIRLIQRVCQHRPQNLIFLEHTLIVFFYPTCATIGWALISVRRSIAKIRAFLIYTQRETSQPKQLIGPLRLYCCWSTLTDIFVMNEIEIRH